MAETARGEVEVEKEEDMLSSVSDEIEYLPTRMEDCVEIS